jgi:hypothetical protein
MKIAFTAGIPHNNQGLGRAIFPSMALAAATAGEPR